MSERRFRPRPDRVARIPCRVCYRAVDLHPEFITRDDRGWAMTCPHCRCAFAVRVDDSLEALVERAADPTSAEPAPQA